MKTTIKIVLFLFVTTFTFGQTPQEKKDKIKALKVAYITEKLDLTTEEAQKFWPFTMLLTKKNLNCVIV